MEEKAAFVIVGGGLAGLFAAKILRDQGLSFVGLEKSDELGGRNHVGHPRLYDESTVEYAVAHLPSTQWIKVEEPPLERRKGEWKAVEEEVSEEESFYLGQPFFSPSQSYKEIVDGLVANLGDSFTLRKNVEKIDAEKKVLVCTDGSEVAYEKLIWCTELELLRKAWKGDASPLLKAFKSLKEIPGGLNLDLQLSAPIFNQQNTVVLPFRYKDSKLRALGIAEKSLLHWMLFLEEEISEDREEVAKCVRALKRELQKEFPTLKEVTTGERILYCTSINGGKPADVKSLDILPDVMYIGPQVRLQESNETLRNLDRTLANVRHFEQTLKG